MVAMATIGITIGITIAATIGVTGGATSGTIAMVIGNDIGARPAITTPTEAGVHLAFSDPTATLDLRYPSRLTATVVRRERCTGQLGQWESGCNQPDRQWSPQRGAKAPCLPAVSRPESFRPKSSSVGDGSQRTERRA